MLLSTGWSHIAGKRQAVPFFEPRVPRVRGGNVPQRWSSRSRSDRIETSCGVSIRSFVATRPPAGAGSLLERCRLP